MIPDKSTSKSNKHKQDRISLGLFGMLQGAAEGRFAISAFVLIVLCLTKSFWWP